MQSIEPTIIISNTDHERLMSLLDIHQTPAAEQLSTELHRAVVVDAGDMPPDIVTMNSQIVYEDCETFARRKVSLVYPSDADAAKGCISVLAPIGSALLGLRIGQSIRWQVPSGTKHIRVVELNRPGISGDSMS